MSAARESVSPASPARTFLVVAGGYLLVVGVLGFLLDASFPTRAEAVRDSHAYLFGLFETNGWHNLAAVLLAVPALVVAWVRPGDARALAWIVGGANVAVFLLFWAVDPTTFWVASNGWDQVAHAAVGFGGLWAAWATSPRRA